MPVVRNSEELDINYIIQLTDIKFYDDFFPKKIASKKYELIRISTDNLTIKLIDKNQKDLLSIVHGKIMVYKNIEYFEIIGTYSKIRQNGYLSYLFEILIYELGKKVVSDSQHTSPGSKEFWLSLINRFRFSIYRLNLETLKKKNVKKIKENQIWTDHIKNEIFDPNTKGIDYYVGEDEDEDENLPELDEFNYISMRNDIVIKEKLLKFENIRLVAQKFVGK